MRHDSEPARHRRRDSGGRHASRGSTVKVVAVVFTWLLTMTAVSLALLGGLADRTKTSAAPGAPSAEQDTGRPEYQDEASRSQRRTAPTSTPGPSGPSPAAPASPSPEAGAAPQAVASALTQPPARPAPVAGLSQLQMDNATTIVKVGKQLQLPRRAHVIAIATALQESDLRNLANPGVPASMSLPHEGTGRDHDSLGLFQQRPSAGWGTVAQLMNPAYAATRFYQKLAAVPGWPNMSLTQAAQAVQRSAFPDAYAKHENRASQIVDGVG